MVASSVAAGVLVLPTAARHFWRRTPKRAALVDLVEEVDVFRCIP
jgi:hypothetical protein